MKYADLHIHTRYSDGMNTAKENVAAAALLGMEAVAITDHDHTGGYYEAKKEADKFGIELLTGVEVSTRQYHILGYGFDIDNKRFQEFLAYSRDIQEGITGLRVDRIRNTGVPITIEKVKKYSPISRLGKCNLVLALVKDKECRDAMNLDNYEDVFEKYLRGVARNVDHSEEISSKQAIDEIHKAGGIAIVAHPFKDADGLKDIDTLIEEGIDGLEVQPNFNGANEMYKRYAEKNGLIVTYGSDYHGPLFDKRPMLRKNGNLVDMFW